MRLTPLLTLLPALVAAQNQVPLADRFQGWLNRAKSYIPTASPVPEPKVIEKIVQKAVTPLNFSNWDSVLEPSEHTQDWLIFVTGGNKTCYGRCEQAEKAFNVCFPVFLLSFLVADLDFSNLYLCSLLIQSLPILHI
jgi:hypothetical protein